jgi:hypothetical protein
MGKPQPIRDLAASDLPGVVPAVLIGVDPCDLSRVPSYPGVARLIQSSGGNFLNAGGDKIVVDGSATTFNNQPLRSIGEASPVYGQINNKDEIPLKQGIVFVYHQQLGILASYGNDKYPYGTDKNPGTVIAQLVLPNGRALPATSIDSVRTENLSRSPVTVPTRRLVVPANPLRPTN